MREGTVLFMEGSQGELPGGGDMEKEMEGVREGSMRTHGRKHGKVLR